MKYDTIKNINYVATVIRVPALVDLEGLDNLKGLQVSGMQALVSKDVQIGDIGILFSTEVQLSEEFAALNNLYRHSNLNFDPTQTGYLEDNRRVKAIKLRGHRSDSLFMPLRGTTWPAAIGEPDFKVGDVFDSINGVEILRKYVIKEPGVAKGPTARVRRVDMKVFPLHTDTENYWRNADKIPQSAPIVVTQKLHGTSVRYGKVPVLRDKPWYERLINRIGIPTVNAEHKFVVGSRMVLKSIDLEAESAGKDHFYATDLWSEYAQAHHLQDLIPPGYLVYGELIGYTYDGNPIQKDYTYDLENPVQGMTKHERVNPCIELYVYRVATVTPEGVVTDLSWPATKAFAHGLGLKTVPELGTYIHRDFTANDWIDKRYYDDWLTDPDFRNHPDTPVELSDKKTVDEGVAVRYDGPNGIYLLKAKSPIFLGHESAMLDQGAEDVEAEEVAS